MGTVYLQFDSQSRSNPYIQKQYTTGLAKPFNPPDPLGNPEFQLRWVPNDNYKNSLDQVTPNGNKGLPLFPYQTDPNQIQTPTNYRVFYKELNIMNNIRTTSFLEHCKEKATNIVFSVENCVATLPSSALVARPDPLNGQITYTSVLNEPYIFARVMPIENSEGNLISSNNLNADKATFILWHDRVQFGQQNQPAEYALDGLTPYPPFRIPFGGPPGIPGPVTPPPIAPTPAWPARPAADVDNVLTTLSTARWLIYKTCMATTMQLNLGSEEWQVRFFDRNGNDIIVGEPDLYALPATLGTASTVDGIPGVSPTIGFPGEQMPGINPDVQTNILMGIRPIYT